MVWQVMSLVNMVIPISRLVRMALEYLAAHDLSDFEEGKSNSAEVCSYTETGQKGDKSNKPRLGWKVSLLLCLVYWWCSAKPSPAPSCMSHSLGGRKGTGSGLGRLSWGCCDWGKCKHRAHSKKMRLMPQWKTSSSKHFISGIILSPESGT